MPTGRGPVNQKGLDFYKRLVDGLHQRGISPFATLFHWDLPQALQDRGGWENRDCASWFADYADAVFRGLGAAVPTWLTINEPKTIVQVGYTFGAMAPGKQDPIAAAVAMHHLALAHGLAVQAFRATGQAGRIGPALNLAPTYPVGSRRRGRPAGRGHRRRAGKPHLPRPDPQGHLPGRCRGRVAGRGPSRAADRDPRR